ncbi:hypothetical protein [Microbacterium sp. 18062]|uniref:hypothetical protein n=1 Tax=Microbacterium sp. 18062 TaxID=2681410 RepID=UPI001357C9CB|nr:hypothetical protein [Microbacterium sp. 18062]
MTTDQIPSTAPERGGGSYVAYEYLSVKAPRSLGALYRDTYRGFGWIGENAEPPDPFRPPSATPGMHSGVVALTLKRDRSIRNRELVQELQRTAERSLAAIARLERHTTVAVVCVAVPLGVVGAALLAAAVLSVIGGLLALSIVLGAAGLLSWMGAFLSQGTVRRRSLARVTPLIDREHDELHEAAGRASRLLA